MIVRGDNAGVVPRFVVSTDGGLLSAHTPDTLIAELPRVHADLRGLAHMVAGSGPMRGRTLFEGIRRVRPGETLRAGSGSVDSTKSWQWADYPTGGGRLEAVIDAITEDLRGATAGRDLVSMLSGGWDSRLLLTVALRDGNASSVRGLTTSSDTGTIMEELVAARVAQILDIPHEVIMPRRDEFAADLRTFAEAVHFQTSFHVWLVPLVRRLAALRAGGVNAPIVLDGLGGGLFVGGAFADPPGPGALLDRRMAGATRYLTDAEAIVRPTVADHLRRVMTEDVEPEVRAYLDHPHGHVLSAYLTRTWPGISLAPHGLVARAATVATPFVTDAVVEAGLAMEPEEHLGDRLYPLLMELIHPVLARVATAQEQVPWPRPHPRRIASIEAITDVRSLLMREPVRALLAPRLLEAGPRTWRRLLSTTGSQHLLRGLAMLSLWWERHGDQLTGPGLEEWSR